MTVFRKKNPFLVLIFIRHFQANQNQEPLLTKMWQWLSSGKCWITSNNNFFVTCSSCRSRYAFATFNLIIQMLLALLLLSRLLSFFRGHRFASPETRARQHKISVVNANIRFWKQQFRNGNSVFLSFSFHYDNFCKTCQLFSQASDFVAFKTGNSHTVTCHLAMQIRLATSRPHEFQGRIC